MKVIICGAGGFAKETIILAKQIFKGKDVELGIIDKDNIFEGIFIEGVPIIGDLNFFLKKCNKNLNDVFAIVAIGDPLKKERAVKELLEKRIKFTTLVSPDVLLSNSVKIDEGCIICSGTKLTSSIKIGKHVIINLSCTVGHDIEIGDYCTISPGVHLSGNTKVGKYVEIGTGAVTIPGIKIGDMCKIGAGAVLTKDIPAFSTAVGIPAKPVKINRKRALLNDNTMHNSGGGADTPE